MSYIGPHPVFRRDTEYRKSVTVQYEQVASTLTNFPVLLSIASDTDLAARVNADGISIYMTEDDGTTIVSTEIEKWDSGTGELKLWFKAPSLSSTIDTVFYLYYGLDNVADNGRDPADVWSNGFDMVAHLTEQTSSLGFADNGVEYAFHSGSINPAAYYYNGKVYIAWQGPGHDPYITTYTIAGGTWATPVQVGTNPLVDDHHGAPGVIVDDSGYIHVFYGTWTSLPSHVGPFKYAKSTNTEDISAWTAQSDVGSNETYANLVKVDDGTIYLFSRSGGSGDGDITYRTSGDSFASETVLLSIDSGYAAYIGSPIYDSANELIHLTLYIWGVVATLRANIYHCYLDLSDSHVYAMDGTDLGTEATRAELNSDCAVVSSGAYNTQTPAMALDSNGDPHIVYAIEQADGTYDYEYTYWTGSAWSSPQTITTSATYLNWCDIYMPDDNTIEAYLPVTVSGVGANMEHWRRSSGSWSKIATVLATAEHGSYSGGFNFAHKVQDGTDDMRWVFCSWSINNYGLTGSELFATDSDDNFLTATANLGQTGQYLKDSTGKGYIPQKKAMGEPAASASGKVVGAQSFDGSDDYLTTGTPAILLKIPEPTAALTIETWIKQAASTALETIVDHGESSSGYFFLLDADGKVWLTINGGGGSAVGTTANDDDTLRYLAGTYDSALGGVEEVKVYVSGIEEGVDDYSTVISYIGTERQRIGGSTIGAYFMTGLLDELRISSVGRTAEWLLTSYKTVNIPGSFIELGSEEVG